MKCKTYQNYHRYETYSSSQINSKMADEMQTSDTLLQLSFPLNVLNVSAGILYGKSNKE